MRTTLEEFARRFYYRPQVFIKNVGLCYYDSITIDGNVTLIDSEKTELGKFNIYENNIKLVLRPLTDMTAVEEKELKDNYGFSFYKFAGIFDNIIADQYTYVDNNNVVSLIDYLDSHGFDYTDLIPRGIAITAHVKTNFPKLINFTKELYPRYSDVSLGRFSRLSKRSYVYFKRFGTSEVELNDIKKILKNEFPSIPKEKISEIINHIYEYTKKERQ